MWLTHLTFAPLQVLEGFNCTVFAYGQTGTGKTHTMLGDCCVSDGAVSDAGGVIPRALCHVFTSLEAAKAEYSVKCTFLELYNEEITDLLSAEEEDPRRGPQPAASRNLALMEDGKGGVLVKGLEEVIVMKAAEVFPLLERGTAKRRTAETLLNKQSSRSHSVFSVTIHIKEVNVDGEELIKVGKLNLVDLAGSENIGRSGATDKRAREAGEINKSLLTLGRVITSLVEHQGHVPYRDSKLTRLLRDALGGRSKTCIIATVAPGVHCLEETLSTLDYAHRAKNIRNKPEVNARTTKTALIKDMVHEIERLKADLVATREKNGVYLAADRWAEYEAERAAARDRADALASEISLREAELAEVRSLFERTAADMAALSERHGTVVADLGATKEELDTTQAKLAETAAVAAETAQLYEATSAAESGLARLSMSLAGTLRGSVAEVDALFSKVERKAQVESANAGALASLRDEVATRLDALHAACDTHAKQQRATAGAAAAALAALRERQEADAAAAAQQVAAMQQAATQAATAARAAAQAVAQQAGDGARQSGQEAQAHAQEAAAMFTHAAAALATAAEALHAALRTSMSAAAAAAERQAAAQAAAQAGVDAVAAAACDSMAAAGAASQAAARAARESARCAAASMEAVKADALAEQERRQAALMEGIAQLVSQFTAASGKGVATAVAVAEEHARGACAAAAEAADQAAGAAAAGTAALQQAACAATQGGAESAADVATHTAQVEAALHSAVEAAQRTQQCGSAGLERLSQSCGAFASAAAAAAEARASAAKQWLMEADAGVAAEAERLCDACVTLGADLSAASGKHQASLKKAATATQTLCAASDAYTTATLPAALDSARAAVVECTARFVRDVPTGSTPLKTTSVALGAQVPSSPVIAAMRAPERDAFLARLRAGGPAMPSGDAGAAAVEEAAQAAADNTRPPSPVAQEQAAPAAEEEEEVQAQAAPREAPAKAGTRGASSRIPRAPGRSRSAPKAEVEEAARSVLGEVSNIG